MSKKKNRLRPVSGPMSRGIRDRGRETRSSRDEGRFERRLSLRNKSRSRSPVLRRAGLKPRDHELRRERSRSRERHGPTRVSIGSGGMGLIAQAREQMRLMTSGKLRMDSPPHSSRPFRATDGDSHRDRDRGQSRKALQDKIGDKRRPERSSARTSSAAALGLGGKRNSNSVFADLDRAVKKAREVRTGAAGGYWNNKVLKAEEKNPDRWGHSGFKEMYRQDMKSSRSSSREHRKHDPARRSRSRSRSRSDQRRRNSGIHRLDDQALDRRSGKAGPSRRSNTPNRDQNRVPGLRVNGGRHISPLLSRKLDNFVPMQSRSRSGRTRKDSFDEKQTYSTRNDTRSGHGVFRPSNRNEDSRTRQAESRRSGSEPRGSKRLQSVVELTVPRTGNNAESSGGRARVAVSRSASRSESSRTPSPQLKRPHSGTADSKNGRKPVPPSRSKSKSNPRSSSSESSSDEDVLELHPRDGKRRTLSRSSSSDDSETGESMGRESRSTSSSSSSTGSESEDESDGHSVGRSNDKDRSRNNQGGGTSSKTVESKQNGKNGHRQASRIDRDSSGTSPPYATASGRGKVLLKKVNSPKSEPKAAEGASTNAAKNKKELGPVIPARKVSATKKGKEPASASGDSESESDSSSESEDEPRMTLSERFAKLTQMGSDKREFAKPEISANDIDTKLKVVKDLRNADTKIYINGHPPSRETKIRPKSPERGEGEARYSSDDRRRHFERMTRDEPRERPDDWADVRVRYSYYKDRGYFNERPLTLDEYVKWEAWWYEYRDWLDGEGYYDQVRNVDTDPHYEPSENRAGWRHGRDEHSQGGRRSSGTSHRRPVQPEPLMSRPITFGGRHGGHSSQYQDVSPNRMGSYHVPISRRIGHAAGGSLVVNIRHGNYSRGRGRLAGRIGVRRN